MLRRFITTTASNTSHQPFKRCFHHHNPSVTLQQLSNFDQQQPIASPFSFSLKNLKNHTQRVVVTLNELGPMNTKQLFEVMHQRYPEHPLTSKNELKHILKQLKSERRLDAKRNPLEEVLKKRDAGFVYHLTLKENKKLLRKKKKKASTPTVATTVAQQLSEQIHQEEEQTTSEQQQQQ